MLTESHIQKGGDTMTNYILLKMAIVRNDMKVTTLCEKCGFSYGYFYKCTSGKQDFRTSEVKKMCDVLNIGADEMSQIFFSTDVDKMAHIEEGA